MYNYLMSVLESIPTVRKAYTLSLNPRISEEAVHDMYYRFIESSIDPTCGTIATSGTCYRSFGGSLSLTRSYLILESSIIIYVAEKLSHYYDNYSVTLHLIYWKVVTLLWQLLGYTTVNLLKSCHIIMTTTRL